MSESGSSEPSLETRLDHAALQIAYQRLPLSLAFTIGTSIVFGLLMRQMFPGGVMATWVGLILLVALARLATWWRYRQARPGIEAIGLWINRLFIGAVAAAAAWSVGALAVRPSGEHFELAVLCIALLGVSSVAVSSLAAHFPSLAGFLVCSLAPLATTLMLERTPGERLAGLLLYTGLAALLAVGWQASRTLRELLKTEIELQAAVGRMRDAQVAAEKASEAKSRFLAVMSHEVRTPLNGILGLAEMLEHATLDDLQRRHLRLLRDSGQNLREIVDDVLDFSRIEAGQMAMTSGPLEPRRLSEELLQLWLPRARAAGLDLRLDAGAELPDKVLGDALRLRQVLNNLIGNALKFTERGSVELRVATEDRGTPVAGRTVRLRFEVRDTGIGIPPEALGRIFDAFTQADDSASRRHGGSGLGLAICRRLVGLMGGLIGVDSVPGRGSLFWISLPMQVAAVDPPREDDRTTRAEAEAADHLLATDGMRRLSGRVLMVEDNPVNRTVCAAMLERCGLEYDEAHDGIEALESAVDGVYDLVLMDCQMPRLDGLEATRRLRARDARARDGSRLPIVALTANAFDEDRERALAAGMDQFLPKPVRLGELHDVLARWLRPATPASNVGDGSLEAMPRAG